MPSITTDSFALGPVLARVERYQSEEGDMVYGLDLSLGSSPCDPNVYIPGMTRRDIEAIAEACRVVLYDAPDEEPVRVAIVSDAPPF